MIPVFSPVPIFTPSGAFPVVAGAAATVTDGGAGSSSSFSINLPASVAAGDLILLFISTVAGVTVTLSGYTSILAGGTHTLNLYYKHAVGGETTAAGTFSGSTTFGAAAYRITGASTSLAPVASAIATATGNAPDSASLTSGFGSVNTLWLSLFATGGAATLTGGATNYTTVCNSSTTGGGGLLGGGSRALNAATENPPQFSISTVVSWGAYTVAVSPI